MHAPTNPKPANLKPAKFMPLAALLASAAATSLTLAPKAASAISLADACEKFASKIQAALAAGDTAKAKMIYSEGSERIASRFNGASCPNVVAP